MIALLLFATLVFIAAMFIFAPSGRRYRVVEMGDGRYHIQCSQGGPFPVWRQTGVDFDDPEWARQRVYSYIAEDLTEAEARKIKRVIY